MGDAYGQMDEDEQGGFGGPEPVAARTLAPQAPAQPRDLYAGLRATADAAPAVPVSTRILSDDEMARYPGMASEAAVRAWARRGRCWAGPRV